MVTVHYGDITIGLQCPIAEETVIQPRRPSIKPLTIQQWMGAERPYQLDTNTKQSPCYVLQATICLLQFICDMVTFVTTIFTINRRYECKKTWQFMHFVEGLLRKDTYKTANVNYSFSIYVKCVAALGIAVWCHCSITGITACQSVRTRSCLSSTI